MKTALLLIDVVNPLDFDGSENILKAAYAAADRIELLRQRARAANVPVIYVNDNYGEWADDFRSLVRSLARRDLPGSELIRRLEPAESDLYVLKPMHSGFFATPLHELLSELGVDRLVLCGIQTHLCVLFTAHDAHMRDYRLVVPEDASATERPEQHEAALVVLRSLGAEIAPAGEIRF